MKKHLTTIIFVMILVIGLSLLLYPSFANWWNSFHQSRAIASYVEQMANMDEDQYDEIWEAARAYNSSLVGRPNNYLLSEEQKTRYEQLLNVTGNGVMGYIEIPKIGVTLPVYHGTDSAVLQVAVGHLDWTSLPVGGESTHCVLSGHRGLPSAKLFTDLDKVGVGDTFLMRVLDEVFTYQVDQVLIVEPHETSELLIQQGQDFCTLVTCTPYGVNSHRILVRGRRIENAENAKLMHVTADAVQIEPILVAPFVSAPILLVLLILLLLPKRKEKRRDGM